MTEIWAGGTIARGEGGGRQGKTGSRWAFNTGRTFDSRGNPTDCGMMLGEMGYGWADMTTIPPVGGGGGGSQVEEQAEENLPTTG